MAEANRQGTEANEPDDESDDDDGGDNDDSSSDKDENEDEYGSDMETTEVIEDTHENTDLNTVSRSSVDKTDTCEDSKDISHDTCSESKANKESDAGTEAADKTIECMCDNQSEDVTDILQKSHIEDSGSSQEQKTSIPNTIHVYTGPELLELFKSLHPGSDELLTTVGMVCTVKLYNYFLKDTFVCYIDSQ